MGRADREGGSMSAPVRVEVDESLADLVAEFLAGKRLDLERLRDSFAPRTIMPKASASAIASR